MRRAAVTLLSALPFLILGNATTALENVTIEPDSGSITVSLLNYRESDVFKRRLNLAPSSALTINLKDIPSNLSFVVLQVHTFQYNATLSYDKTLLDKVSDKSLFGSNIGLYLKTHNAAVPIQVFLRHDNVHNLDALLVIMPYARSAPIPGGCNMEFEIEVAPYQKLRMGNEMITVDAQPASVLAADGSPAFPCEKNPVQHRMYRFYLPRQDFSPETYFAAIESMLTVQDIARNGVEIPPAHTSPSMRRVYSAFTGTGSVYAVVATYGNYSSAYVPTFTYACSPLLYPESCQVLNDTFSKVICALVLFIGFLSIVIGHKYALVDRLLSSCMMGGFIGYTLAVGTSDPGTAINVLIGLILATLVAFISVFLHNRVNEAPLYALLCNLPLGFLWGCIAYLYAPGVLFHMLENNWLFWSTFASLMLIVAMFPIMISHAGPMVSRAVFGSYFLVIALDYYIGTNLKYIIINLVRRITIPGFHVAFVYPPHQSLDIALAVIWVVLIMVRFIKLGTYSSKSFADEERQSLLSGRESRRRSPTVLCSCGPIRKHFLSRRYR